MKKNLRIVSAAAAALLAVAPIAAAGVSTVNAAGDNGAVSDINSNNVAEGNANWGIGSVATGTKVNVTPNLLLNAQNKNAGITKSTLTGTITANVGGQNYTAVYNPNGSEATKVTVKNRGSHAVINNGADLTAGVKYDVEISSLAFNFGTANANKELTLTLPKGDTFQVGTSDVNSAKVRTSSAGTVSLKNVKLVLTAKDMANVSSIYFVNKDLGNVVTSGNVTLNANSNGEANIATVVAAAKKAYTAYQVNLDNGRSEGIVSLTDNVKDALTKAGITVDSNGFFKAPHSFNFELTANSSVNNASAKLPVTVTFANVAAPTPTTVASQSKTIMHGAYLYDNKGVRVPNTAEIHAYDSVTVATKTTQINGKAYYEVINNGKATGHFINAGNIDGTSRKLTHNAYVYNTKGHRVKSEGTWKKGSTHTTYGATITVKGHKMFRVAQYRYVKAANF